MAETVAHRASRIDSDIDKAAVALDTKYPGSTVLAEKKKYGEGGKYLALVTGSLGNCSADLNVVVDLIAGVNTVRALELRITNQDQLFSMHRRRLVCSPSACSQRASGLATSMTASVMPLPSQPPPTRTISLIPIAKSPGTST